MGTLLPLLTANAVPFNLPRRSIASRRRRHPAGDNRAPILDPELDLVAEVLNETGRAIDFVATSDASTNTGPMPPATVVPPNTPAQLAGQRSFEFPEVDEELVRQKSPRRRQKRRRAPSFKKGHRVAPKVPCHSEEADDEDSGDDVAMEDSDEEAKRELCLKLRIYSEAQKAMRGQEDDSSSSEDEKRKEPTNWHKVGEELRLIAASFQNRDGARPQDGSREESSTINVLSALNMMLPISIPQSVWSAIVSYAAWKFFKRF